MIALTFVSSAGGLEKLPIDISPISAAILSLVGRFSASEAGKIGFITNFSAVSTSSKIALALINSSGGAVTKSVLPVGSCETVPILVSAKYSLPCSADMCCNEKTLYRGGSEAAKTEDVKRKRQNHSAKLRIK